jgi:hypothetical protein
MVAAIGMLEDRNSTDFFSPQVVGKLTQLPSSEHVTTSNAGSAPASKTPLPDLSTRCTRGHDRCRRRRAYITSWAIVDLPEIVSSGTTAHAFGHGPS